MARRGGKNYFEKSAKQFVDKRKRLCNRLGMKQKQPLIVTTAHRGVFFGYGIPTENKTIRLEKARMAIYWSSDVKGVVGLASTGPTKDCKIGPPAPALTLQDVTSVMEVSDTAAKQWEIGPWS